MKLHSILESSAYCTIGTVNTDSDVDTLTRYILYNKEFIDNFPYKIAALNGEMAIKAELVWKEYFNDIIVINLKRNLGHTFGTIDLDAAVIREAKCNDKIKWVWKFSNDCVITDDIFNKEVLLADFYYFNNVGYSSLIQWNFDIPKLVSDLLNGITAYPQTNFYIISTKVDELIDIQKLEEGYNLWKSNTSNKKPWEVVPGIDCETVLLNCTLRNKLISYQLLSSDALTKLCTFIQQSNLTDGSYKNIMFTELGNFCHYQYVDNDVLVL